jgi:hypothetical protein
MAGVGPFVSRRFRGRRYCVLIEMTYAGGRLDDDRRQMLTAEINVPGARANRDLVVTMSPDAVSIVTVSATVDAANPRAALALVDEALDRALMTTGLFEEFDVTGKVLRVAPLQQANRIHQQPAGTGPASV